MSEPRSLPELVEARARGGLAGEEFVDGLTFGDLGDRSRAPAWLHFLHDPASWRVECDRGIAVFDPITPLIAARTVARAMSLNEYEPVQITGDLTRPRIRVAGIAAVLYAGGRIVDDRSDAEVAIDETTFFVDGGGGGDFAGWPETLEVGAFVRGSDVEWLERMEADVLAGELVVRGPLVMAGYMGDAEETARAFAGGWFHTGQPARRTDAGEIVFW